MTNQQIENTSETNRKPSEKKDPNQAFLGTIFIPGFTEFYLGNTPIGIIWTAFIYVLYVTLVSGQWWLVIPGAVVHLILIYKSQDKVEFYNQGNDPLYADVEYEEGVE